MEINKVPVGTPIEVGVEYNGETLLFRSEVISNNASGISLQFCSDQDKHIVTEAIRVHGHILKLEKDMQASVTIVVKNKCYYFYPCGVKSIQAEDGKLYTKISYEEDTSAVNRRSCERYPVNERVDINSDTGTLSVMLRDISATGIGLYVEDDMEVEIGTRLSIVYKDEDKRDIRLLGEVVRLANTDRGLDLGLKLIDVQADSVQYIIDLQKQE